jgi:hypothetical protein
MRHPRQAAFLKAAFPFIAKLQKNNTSTVFSSTFTQQPQGRGRAVKFPATASL